jgi:sigma-B regulation protein RsbU (phosphoserine phosphatase)
MKLRFFTNVSHELRTPLSLIITPLESIIQKVDPSSIYHTQLKGVLKHANELLDLVNRLLDFRKLSMGEMKLHPSSGDLFDFRIRDERLYFCIGDVSGKGIPAAMVMTVISSMFRTLSASEDSPHRIMTAINDTISARNENLMFVTLFVGSLDLSTGVLQYTNAGHNAPFVITDGVPRMMPVDANIPVGIMADWSYSLQETTLSPGTILFLYTDGLTEATRSDGELFQEERVQAQLSGHDENTSAERLVADMTAAVNRFIGNAEQSDDLTMLVLKLLRKSQD